MEEAIKKAIKGGYPKERNEVGPTMYSYSKIFLDPEFWKALGKAMGHDSSVVIELCGKKTKLDSFVVENIIDGYYWEITPKGYLRGKPKSGGKKIFLHRLVKDTQEGEFTDHINGDKLDNRNVNLRIVSLRENAHNKSITKGGKYRGVYFYKPKNLYAAVVVLDRKKIYAGYFKDKEKAALEAEKLRQKLYGIYHKGEVGREWWHEQMHCFIDHLAAGKDAESFFNELLK